MTTYYLYDPETKIFAGAVSAMVQPDNATTVAVPDGLYQPTFDGQAWTGISADEYAKQSEQPPAPAPTIEQQTLMQQAADIMQLRQLVMAQASQIAILSKGSAQ
ncbi:hypothetical protein [Lactiplantibacillus plantarum]|uniref:hypothetical protein n=1 Tax=Lactiplantibacillus plantarum TaxID=1590 RepID=UPI000823FC25|nr:hypothetical protein [Lactiplantibacillus plantarum]ATL77918.1 hypothetical protein CRG99_04620 [Lactiplantibacillus plantarum]MZU25389.1 hypothetical protein [Lactiplantibacillus plantarum]MZU56523.1 hypothetical protein [Lactiplantibacillus plantarum]MZU73275.1 hypothetical protein [Lactiplantibacillus plantarum]MZV21548.1 hypothetical protein [Lactiplantibacillus plantarum]